MGNRAVMAFADEAGTVAPFGIYLHWNGGIESVAAFLAYAKEVNHREGDINYSTARLTQVIGNYFGGSLSLGINPVNPNNPGDCDPGDNGVFLIDCSGKTHGPDRIIAHYSEDYTTKKIKKTGKTAMKAQVSKAVASEYFTKVLDGVREANANVEHAKEAM